MWELCLLANDDDVTKQSAREMLNVDTCKCPGYILSKANVLTIQGELTNKSKVSLVLLDRTNQERYEGQVQSVKGTGREVIRQTRWDIKGKGIHKVPYKDEDHINYAGVRFRPVKNNSKSSK